MSNPFFRRVWASVPKPHIVLPRPARPKVLWTSLKAVCGCIPFVLRSALDRLAHVGRAGRLSLQSFWDDRVRALLIRLPGELVRSWRLGCSIVSRFWANVPKSCGSWLAHLWIRIRCDLRDPEFRLVGGIILLAGVLRLSYLDLIPFGSEQARHLLGGLELVQSLNPPLIGIRTPSGIAQPPLMNYLLAIPLLVGRDPRIAAALLALLHVLAVAGCYFIARRYWGLGVAAISATLFAVNPWSVFLARRISAASLLVPLAVLEMWALYRSLVDGKPWGWVAAWLVLGVMIGVTLSASVVIVVLVVLMLAYARRAQWLYIVLGVLLFLIILSPYLYHQNLHRLQDIQAFFRESLQRTKDGSPLRAWRYAAWLHSERQLFAFLGASEGWFWPLGSALIWLDRLSVWLFLFSLPWVGLLAVCAWSRWRCKQDPMRFVVLFVWLWLPLLLWALYLGPSEPYDLALLYPASFWAMGLAVDSLIGWLKSGGGRSWRWLAWVQLPIWLLLVGMISWQGYRIVYLYDWLAHHDAQQGGYGTPYRFWRHVANLARRSVKGTGTNQVWVVTEGTDPDRDEQPLVLRYLLEPHVEPIFLGQNGTECMLLPAGRPAIYLLSRSAPRVEQMLHRLRAEEKGVVLSPGGTREVRVWALPWHEVEDMLGLVSQRGLWRWDSGLWLVGYDLPAMAKPGESMTFISSWTFKDIPPRELAARHILFGYLVGSDGAYAASWADLGLPERYWAEGLLLLHWMELKLPETAPEGGYTFLLGMDRLDDAYRHQLTGAQGQILGETLSLGPVHVSR